MPRRVVVVHFNPPNLDKRLAKPKKTSGLQSDLSEREVRTYALDRGLVDVKIAAIDETWSGLRFSRKKPSL